MPTDTHAPITFSAGPALSRLREASRRRPASTTGRDVARELPGYPETGRAGFAISLLGDDRRHIAFV